MQKNGGYNLEHAYSSNVLAVKNFYLLLQIAHIIAQFMEYGLLGKKVIRKVYGSVRNVAYKLLEEFKSAFLDNSAIDYLNKKIWVSFDTQ